VLDDLAAGKPMDRLICGDVGFGKTEVALRAAFVAAMSGKQVAVVGADDAAGAPAFPHLRRTLPGLPVKVGAGCRASSGQGAQGDQGRALATAPSTSSSARMRCWPRAIKFKDLGLLIVDEEQHFGVAHKERLKELRAPTCMC
jgi:transcription-repair coupling factor (superfamily II helicase)